MLGEASSRRAAVAAGLLGVAAGVAVGVAWASRRASHAPHHHHHHHAHHARHSHRHKHAEPAADDDVGEAKDESAMGAAGADDAPSTAVVAAGAGAGSAAAARRALGATGRTASDSSILWVDENGTPLPEPPPTACLFDPHAAEQYRARQKHLDTKRATEHVSFAAYVVHKLLPRLSETDLLSETLREAAHGFLMNKDNFFDKLRPLYVVHALANGCPDDVCPISFCGDLTTELEGMLMDYFLRMDWTDISRAYEVNAAEGRRKRRKTVIGFSGPLPELPRAADGKVVVSADVSDAASEASEAADEMALDAWLESSVAADKELAVLDTAETKGAAPAASRSANKKQANQKWVRLRNAIQLKVTEEKFAAKREFVTLLTQLKALKHGTPVELLEDEERLSRGASGSESGGSDSPAPHTYTLDTTGVGITVGRRERDPVLLMLGGGMAAGKSTVVAHLMKYNERLKDIMEHAVVIEADAFKMADPVFLELQAKGVDASRKVHGHSTRAAEQLLMMAVRTQRDIVFDGTMSWPPFVEQTIAMVRDYQHTYKMGAGYVVHEDGATEENYWQVTDEGVAAISASLRRPYHIEMIGVTCDPEVAVARGLRRHLMVGRGVPFGGQLQSHKAFSMHFTSYVHLVDKATLYDTGIDTEPQVIAKKFSGGVYLVHAPSYSRFLSKALINTKATGFPSLYLSESEMGSAAQKVFDQWHEAGLDMVIQQQKASAMEVRARRQRVIRALVMASEHMARH